MNCSGKIIVNLAHNIQSSIASSLSENHQRVFVLFPQRVQVVISSLGLNALVASHAYFGNLSRPRAALIRFPPPIFFPFFLSSSFHTPSVSLLFSIFPYPKLTFYPSVLVIFTCSFGSSPLLLGASPLLLGASPPRFSPVTTSVGLRSTVSFTTFLPSWPQP